MKVCLVGSSGGHLTHLYMLKPFWKDKDHFWVTFDKEDARSLGVYGAAIATCISYILVFVFRLFHTRKYIQYNINNKEFIVGSTALVLSAGLMFIDNRFGFLLQCVILAVTIYLFSDIWLPIVRKILKLKGR